MTEVFDARVKWNYCRSLFIIHNQGNCRGCWAVAAAAAMSDRLCIATNGTIQVELSAEELLSCVSDSHGCHTGWPYHAWKYLVEQGVVTGGSYGSKDSCLPYSTKPCGISDFDIECQGKAPTPSCVRQCQPGYNISFQEDKHYGKSYYNISNSTIAIQRDIMTYGPVTAGFKVYEDFRHFISNKTGGIYR
ncbi:Peptidase C1 and/or Propeptide C1 domain containing protein, partial [Trichostrongylus colubriformis]